MKKLGIVLLTVLVLCSFSMTAFAVEFTPSVERKDAPPVVEITSSEGVPCEAIIAEPDGSETLVTTNTDLRLVVTPVAQKENAIVVDITHLLDDAERQVQKASTVADLTVDMVQALQNLKNITTDPAIKELRIGDLVICDLFDVSLVRDGIKLEALAEGETVTFSLKTDFIDEDVFFILHNVVGDRWDVVDTFELADDGTLTITLDSLSPLAIVVDRMHYNALRANGPTSPQTGDFSDRWLLTGTATFGAAAILFAARGFSARKKQAEE